MSAMLILSLIALIAGIVLRVTTQTTEARFCAWTRDLLTSTEHDDHEAARRLLLDRVSEVMNAGRLARLASLLLIAPAAAVLLDFAIALVGDVPFTAAIFITILVFAILLTLTFLLGSAVFIGAQRRKQTGRTRLEESPEWLLDEELPPPVFVRIGASIWRFVLKAGQLVMRPTGLERPMAQLVERDGHILIAIGKGEVGALDKQKDEKRDISGERDEQSMIRAIQRLDQTLVREVMRPLNSVTAINLTNMTAERFLVIARKTGFTRFPCYYDQITNLIGYLNVHDFLETAIVPKDLRRSVHDALYIPEVARVDVALQEMLRTRSQIAICFDEFGGCSGLLSREDIIEEITGEIMDEYDRPELKIIEQHGTYLVDGGIDIDDLAEAIGLELEKKNCDTLAGFILQRLSRMPRRSERIEEQDWTMEVVQLDGHRIKKVRIIPPLDGDRADE